MKSTGNANSYSLELSWGDKICFSPLRCPAEKQAVTCTVIHSGAEFTIVLVLDDWIHMSEPHD